MHLPDDPIGNALEKSARKTRFRHFLHRVIYLGVALQGLRWLYVGINDILFVYPKFASYYQMSNFGQEAYMQLVGQVVLVSITSFIETAVGLGMMVKKSHAVENIHMVMGIVIFLLSFYFRKSGITADPHLLEELSALPSLLKTIISG